MSDKKLSNHGLLLRAFVQAIVDHPSHVEVRETNTEHNTHFEIRVCPSDSGQALGQRGIVLDAIRDVMSAIGMRTGLFYTLRLTSDGPRLAPPEDPMTPEAVKSLLDSAVRALITMPDSTVITHTRGAHLHVYEVQVHPSCIGCVLGKEGRTVAALRLISRSIQGKLRLPIHIHVVEPFWAANNRKREAA